MKTLVLAALITLIPLSACAGFGHRGHQRGEHWEMRNSRGWRHGHWYRGDYAGRRGFWWIVGTTWYFYERPVYPYPDMAVAPSYWIDVPPLN